jgi:hypothetical protein
MKWLKNLFVKKPKKEAFNYHMQNHQSWGNAIYFSDWDKNRAGGFLDQNIIRVHGHLFRIPEVGDTLTCDCHNRIDKSRKITMKFEFIKVDRCNDPKDMFFAKVKNLGCVEGFN